MSSGARGGGAEAVAAAIARLTQRREDGEPYLELAADPLQAEVVGRHLATLLEPHRPSMVISWAREDDAVLAHIVATQLGIRRTSLELDLGLITAGRAIAEGTRGVLVGAEARDGRSVSTVQSLMEGERSTLVAAGYLRLKGGSIATGSAVPVLSLDPLRP